MTTFKDLGLSSSVLEALTDLGFKQPTEIQEEAIPILLNGDNDFIGLAQTGTGKTAAFGLPLIEHINVKKRNTQALILSPTRELGKQIAEQLALYSKRLEKINVLPVYGGASIVNQMKALKKTQHIIIATPGRLIDLINRKAIHLEKLEYLVLDEADEMLKMGFKEDLDKILSYTPANKKTWLFSATMPSFIKKITKTYMSDPVEVRINPKEEVNSNIKHRYVTIRNSDKTEALKRFLDIHGTMRGLVFCRTKRETQSLAERLLMVGYKVDALHGDLSQAHRDRVMNRFRSNELQVLIATDVAARGIDVNDLTHVFHFTLPDELSYYTHRSGRTARAGKRGISISFISGKEKYRITKLEKALKIEFKKILVPANDEIVSFRIKKWCQSVLNEDVSKLDPDLVGQAVSFFRSLTKEELISALLSKEYSSLHLGSNRDLNDEESSGGGRSSRSKGGGSSYRGKKRYSRKDGPSSKKKYGKKRFKSKRKKY